MKMAYYDRNGKIEYECKTIADLKIRIHQLKNEFIEFNKVVNINTDKYYINYAKELDDILKSYTHKHLQDDYFCDRCLPDEQNDEFCKCVDRNIRIAKKNREPLNC